MVLRSTVLFLKVILKTTDSINNVCTHCTRVWCALASVWWSLLVLYCREKWFYYSLNRHYHLRHYCFKLYFPIRHSNKHTPVKCDVASTFSSPGLSMGHLYATLIVSHILSPLWNLRPDRAEHTHIQCRILGETFPRMFRPKESEWKFSSTTQRTPVDI